MGSRKTARVHVGSEKFQKEYKLLIKALGFRG